MNQQAPSQVQRAKHQKNNSTLLLAHNSSYSPSLQNAYFNQAQTGVSKSGMQNRVMNYNQALNQINKKLQISKQSLSASQNSLTKPTQVQVKQSLNQHQISIARKQSMPSSFAQHSIPSSANYNNYQTNLNQVVRETSHGPTQVPISHDSEISQSFIRQQTGTPIHDAKLKQIQGSNQILVGKGSNGKVVKSHAKYFSQQNSPVAKQLQQMNQGMGPSLVRGVNNQSQPDISTQKDQFYQDEMGRLNYSNFNNPSIFTIQNPLGGPIVMGGGMNMQEGMNDRGRIEYNYLQFHTNQMVSDKQHSTSTNQSQMNINQVIDDSIRHHSQAQSLHSIGVPSQPNHNYVKLYHSSNQGPVISSAAANQTVATNNSMHSVVSNQGVLKPNTIQTQIQPNQIKQKSFAKQKYDEQYLNGSIHLGDNQQSLIEDTLIAHSSDTQQQMMASANAKRYMNNHSQLLMHKGILLDESGYFLRGESSAQGIPISEKLASHHQLNSINPRTNSTMSHNLEKQQSVYKHSSAIGAHRQSASIPYNGVPKFSNYDQSFDKMHQELFQKQQINPNHKESVSEKQQQNLNSSNQVQHKILATSQNGVKSMKRQQKALTRPGSNKKIKGGDIRESQETGAQQRSGVPTQNIQVPHFDIKRGVLNSKTQNNSLTRPSSKQEVGQEVTSPNISMSMHRPSSPNRLKMASPNSIILPQNQMIKTGQKGKMNPAMYNQMEHQYSQVMQTKLNSNRGQNQSQSALSKQTNIASIYQHNQKSSIVSNKSIVSHPDSLQNSVQVLNAVNRQSNNSLQQNPNSSRIVNSSSQQKQIFESKRLIDYEEEQISQQTKMAQNEVIQQMLTQESRRPSVNVLKTNMQSQMSDSYPARAIQLKNQHHHRQMTQTSSNFNKIHRANTKTNSHTDPNSNQNSARKQPVQSKSLKAYQGGRPVAEEIDLSIITADQALKTQQKINQVSINQPESQLVQGNGGIVIQQMICKNSNSQKNIQPQVRAGTSNSLYLNRASTIQNSPHQVASQSKFAPNYEGIGQINQQQSNKQIGTNQNGKKQGNQQTNQNNLLIVQIFNKFNQKGANYPEQQPIYPNQPQKTLKYKVNSNGIIIHPKNAKGQALTTSANTAMNSVHNSPKFLVKPGQNRLVPQSHDYSQKPSSSPINRVGHQSSNINQMEQNERQQKSEQQSQRGAAGKNKFDEIESSGKNPVVSSHNLYPSKYVKSTQQTNKKQTKDISPILPNRDIRLPKESQIQVVYYNDGPLVTEEEELEIRQVASDINEQAFFGKILRTKQIIASGKNDANQLRRLSPRSQEIAYVMGKIDLAFQTNIHKAPETKLDFYRIGKMLGRGAFGKVNLAMHKLVRKLVALKSLNKECLTDQVQKQKLMKEVNLLLKLRHDHVVKIYETIETKKHIIIVMELCAGGDLLNYVRKRRRLKEPYAKKIFKQIIEGLEYIHSKHIAHRDIKLDNILLDGKGSVKIADFGVSKQSQPGVKMREQCGTPAYIAPEILKNKNGYSNNVDLWSAGVVLFAMLYGTVPFKASNIDELHGLILRGIYTLKDDISQEARDMLRGLLEINPYKRLTIAQILSHPWLQDLDEKLDLFNDQERDMIRKEYTYNDPSRYNRNDNEEPVDCFTEHNIDSVYNTLKNVSDKSIILAPFNSTQSEDMQVFKKSISHLIVEKQIVLRLSRLCREVDRQYEFNNNGQLDNGVYHKQILNMDNKSEGDKQKEKKKGEDQGSDEDEDDDLKFQVIQCSKSQGVEFNTEDYQDDEETRKQNKKQFVKNMMAGLTDQERQLIESTFGTNKEMDIDESKVDKLVQFGYPRDYVYDSLRTNEANYLTAGYYLLQMDQNYC